MLKWPHRIGVDARGTEQRVMEKLLKIEQVEEIVGFKKSWIYERIAEKTFPDSIPFGAAKRWALSHIQGWMQKQIKQQSPGATK